MPKVIGLVMMMERFRDSDVLVFLQEKTCLRSHILSLNDEKYPGKRHLPITSSMTVFLWNVSSERVSDVPLLLFRY